MAGSNASGDRKGDVGHVAGSDEEGDAVVGEAATVLGGVSAPSDDPLLLELLRTVIASKLFMEAPTGCGQAVVGIEFLKGEKKCEQDNLNEPSWQRAYVHFEECNFFYEMEPFVLNATAIGVASL